VPKDDVVAYEDHIKSLLEAIRSGDRPAFDALVEAVGHEMRKLAAYHLRQRSPAQTLQTTALVHEAVLRMIHMLNRQRQTFPESKEHLMALVSQMMRFTLTDYARKRKLALVSLDEPSSRDDRATAAVTNDVAMRSRSANEVDTLLAVDEALSMIEKSDAKYGKRRSAALELYLFGGMSFREIAGELGVTDDTARRDCQLGLGRLRGILDNRSTSSSSLTS
jgi:RNA polymerase sigma factor (TIGR02999 family)